MSPSRRGRREHRPDRERLGDRVDRGEVLLPKGRAGNRRAGLAHRAPPPGRRPLRRDAPRLEVRRGNVNREAPSVRVLPVDRPAGGIGSARAAADARELARRARRRARAAVHGRAPLVPRLGGRCGAALLPAGRSSVQRVRAHAVRRRPRRRPRAGPLSRAGPGDGALLLGAAGRAPAAVAAEHPHRARARPRAGTPRRAT